MDTWLLLCMIFVALALFEYAFQLAIRYQGRQCEEASSSYVGVYSVCSEWKTWAILALDLSAVAPSLNLINIPPLI